MMGMNAVELVATVTTPFSPADLLEIPQQTAWLQLRADLADGAPADWLRNYFSGRLIYSLRSGRAGGKFDDCVSERYRRLISAASEYDLVELEADSDLVPELLEKIPANKRMISCHGARCAIASFRSAWQQVSVIPARYYCVTTTATRSSDGLQPLLFLQDLKRRDVIAICEGPSGLWGRLLSPYFGAPLLFGQLDHQSRALGELHIQQLISDYGFPALYPLRELYGMVGNRLFQSPSPRLHNAAYRELGYPALFLPFHVEHFEDFWQEMVKAAALHSLGIPVRGLVVVSPHKEAAVAVADAHSFMVRKAAASNVFIHRNDAWEAE